MFGMVARLVKRARLIIVCAPLVFINFCFKTGLSEPDWLAWSNKLLSQDYDGSAEKKLKKWDITITVDDFLRLRKTYKNKKQVYYSLNLKNLNKVNYLGNTNKGTLQLKTMADDIIVQTRNDHRGDLDEMAAELDIPLKHIKPQRLDSLKEALNYLKNKGL